MIDPLRADAAYASNPAIPAQDMQVIAENRPDLLLALASNPALYPDLRAWLSQSPDPNVRAALARSAVGTAEVSGPAPTTPMSTTPSAPTLKEQRRTPRGKRTTVDPTEPPAWTGPTVSSTHELDEAEPKKPKTSKARIAGFVAVGTAFILAFIGAGVFAFFQLFVGGAASAQGVGDTIDRAVVDRDLGALYAIIAPSERKERVALADIEAGAFDFDRVIGADALADYLASIDVTRSTMTFDVQEKSENVASVDITRWDLDYEIKPGFAAKVRDRYVAASGGVAPTAVEQSYFEELGKLDGRKFNGDVIQAAEVQAIHLIAVREEGRWYLSPAMTYVENILPPGSSPDYGAQYADAPGADSPEGAVAGFVDAVTNAGSPISIADGTAARFLPLAERRIARIYGADLVRMFEGESGWDAAFSSDFRIRWALKAMPVTGGTVVSPGATNITVGDARYVFNGMSVKTTINGDEFDVDLAQGLDKEDRFGLFTFKENGTWRVSAGASALNLMTLRAKDGAADSGLDLIRKTWRIDPSKYTEAADLVHRFPQGQAGVTVLANLVEPAKKLYGRRALVEWAGYPVPAPDALPGGNVEDSKLKKPCADGDMASCDALYERYPDDDKLDYFAATCGERTDGSTPGKCAVAE